MRRLEVEPEPELKVLEPKLLLLTKEPCEFFLKREKKPWLLAFCWLYWGLCLKLS